MAGLGALVDLSLFATSPTDDRRFTASSISRAEHATEEQSCYRAQRELNYSYGREFAMKPLPPLPHRRICERRPGSRRVDPNSRCILTRIRRVRTNEHLGDQSPSLQQRRAAMTPQLTLSLPQASRDGGYGGNVRPTMIWLPEEQMWLIQDAADRNAHPDLWSYPPQPMYQYTRSEPSPERSAQFDLPPLGPFRDEPPDEIRDQFLRLIESQQDERLSPLFQEAIQSVPPMTDPSPSTPHFPYEIDRDWVPRTSYETEANRSQESSEQQSYHTAHASLTSEPRNPPRAHSFPNPRDSLISPNSRTTSWLLDDTRGSLGHSRHHPPWSPIPITPAEEEHMSVVSQVSRGGAPWSPWSYIAVDDDPDPDPTRDGALSVVSQVTQERVWGEEPRNVVSHVSVGNSWEVLARKVARPASAMS